MNVDPAMDSLLTAQIPSGTGPGRGDALVSNWAKGRGAMKVLADGRWKAVDCGEVVGGNRLFAVVHWRRSNDIIRPWAVTCSGRMSDSSTSCKRIFSQATPVHVSVRRDLRSLGSFK